MNGLLVRVGIDSTDGCWNAPMRLRLCTMQARDERTV